MTDSTLVAANAAHAAVPLRRLVRQHWWQRAQQLTLRRLDAADAPLLLALYRAQTRLQLRLRFHGAVQPSEGWVRRMCAPAGPGGNGLLWSALVVAGGGSNNRSTPEQAVAELCLAERRPGMVGDSRRSGEFALLVDRRWHGLGIGSWALQVLASAAQAHGLHWLQADVQEDNPAMLALATRCGFVAAGPTDDDDQTWRVQRRIPALPAMAAGMATERPAAAFWPEVA